jgi:hypothetical protein
MQMLRTWSAHGLRASLVLLSSTVALAVAAPTAARAANPIQVENSLPGTPGWYTPFRPRASGIKGYASEVSVTPGQSVHLHVTTATAGNRYRIEVYRVGWYNQVGARLLTCLPSCTTDEPAVLRPALPAPDPTTGYLDVGWPVTDVVNVGNNWVSGFYLAKLVVTVGGSQQAQYVPFIVREATPSSPILVQIEVNTWEAYNNYGGKSLYTFNSTHKVAAVEVSFNRPFTGPDWWQYDMQLIRFLESRGYDVSYATDVDTDQGVDAPSSRKLVILAGHGEYWSKAIRDALDAAQQSGTNLVVTGANTGFWQMRYSTDYRGIYEYRTAAADPDPNPATKTVEFRQLNPPRPECLLEGEMDKNGLGNTPPSPNYSVAPGALSNPWFSGTGFTQASTLNGLVGYEWDTAGQSGCPAVQKLFTWTGTNVYGLPSEADAIEFTAPSGARVFAAGSMQFPWGLDGFLHNPAYVSPILQAFTQNMLNDLSG